MSDFNFDTAPSRVGTDSQKWQKYAGRDILPLWVADMDFVSAPAIVEAIQQRAAHGIFGYAQAHEGLNRAIIDYLRDRRDADVPILPMVVERLLRSICQHPIWAAMPEYKPSFEKAISACDRNDYTGCLEQIIPPQLALYRAALEKRLGLPVARCSLYSFAYGEELVL